MNRQIGVGIGVCCAIILTGIIYPLLGKLSLNSSINHVTAEQVNQYINGSENIQLLFSKYTVATSYYKDVLRTKSVRSENYTFYDSNHHKYFSIKVIGGIYVIEGALDAVISKQVEATVNAAELNNPDYGTTEQPVPILKLQIQEDSTWKNYAKTSKADLDRINKNYPDAVKEYLTYFMPTKAFRKMFLDK